MDNKNIYGDVSGLIIDEKTKRPIEGAIVFIHWQSEIIPFERSPGPAVYVEETVTDKMGRFRLDSSSPLKSKSSMNLSHDTPYISVFKEGYGLYSEGVNHTKGLTGIKRITYKPKIDKTLKIELIEASTEEIFSNSLKSRSSSFLRNLSNITNPYHCFSDDIPKTLEQLSSFTKNIDNELQTTAYYLGFTSILFNSGCPASYNSDGEK